jgi:Na+/glutamate symporter
MDVNLTGNITAGLLQPTNNDNATALIGLFGAIAGILGTILVQFLQSKSEEKRRIDEVIKEEKKQKHDDGKENERRLYKESQELIDERKLIYTEFLSALFKIASPCTSNNNDFENFIKLYAKVLLIGGAVVGYKVSKVYLTYTKILSDSGHEKANLILGYLASTELIPTMRKDVLFSDKEELKELVQLYNKKEQTEIEELIADITKKYQIEI